MESFPSEVLYKWRDLEPRAEAGWGQRVSALLGCFTLSCLRG